MFDGAYQNIHNQGSLNMIRVIDQNKALTTYFFEKFKYANLKKHYRKVSYFTWVRSSYRWFFLNIFWRLQYSMQKELGSINRELRKSESFEVPVISWVSDAVKKAYI